MRLIIYDDKSDPTTSKTLYEKLITVDNVDFIIGPFSSMIGIVIAGLAEQYEMFHIQPCTSSIPPYQQGYTYLFSTTCVGGTTFDAFVPLFKMIDEMPAEQKPETVACIHLTDVYGRDSEKPVQMLCDKYGLEYVFTDEMPPDTKDTSGVITKMKGFDPDVVLDTCWVPVAILNVRAYRDLGWGPEMLQCGQASNPDFRDPLAELAVGVTFNVVFHPEELRYESSPISFDAFVDAHEEEYGGVPSPFTAQGFACCQVTVRVIENTMSLQQVIDKEQGHMRDWCRNNDHQTVNGLIHYSGREDLRELGFDTMGICDSDAKMCQYQEDLGSGHIVWPDQYKAREYIWPWPMGDVTLD
jgi:branched-chain amino acid transport system substrate-binding protein